DVDAAELCHGFPDKALAAHRLRDVELEPCDGARNPVDPPGAADDSCAFTRERQGRRGTDTARRAGDDGRLSLQAGHRWTLTTEWAVTRHGFTQFDLGRRRLGVFDLKSGVGEAEPIAEDPLEPPA